MQIGRFASVLIGLHALTACATYTNHSISVEPAHLVCRSDEDCTRMRGSCSDCGIAVAAEFESLYREQLARLCKRYRGPVVDCPGNPALACEEGRCSYAPEPWMPSR
jgi:hypothetical protein